MVTTRRPTARGVAAVRAHVDLFPVTNQRSTALGWCVAAVAVVVATAVTIGRLSGSSPLDTLYAEDGRIFLSEALSRSTVAAWTTAYNGYIHLVPRLVASLAAAVGIGRSAMVFSITSSIVLALVALVVFWATAPYVRSTALRALLAVSMIALPAAQTEVYNNAANLHWYLVFASFWVLLWNPSRRWPVVTACVIVALAGLSDPLTVLLVPIALLRLVVVDRGWARLPVYAFATALAVQFFAMAVTDSSRPFAEYANPVKLPVWFVFHVGGASVLGDEILGDQTAISFGAALLVTAILGFVVWRGTRPLSSPRAQVAILATATAVGFYFASVFLTGLTAPRYEALPILLVYSALILGLDGILEHEKSTAVRVLGVGVAVVVLTVWCMDLRFTAPRSSGSDLVEHARSGRGAVREPGVRRRFACPSHPVDWVGGWSLPAIGSRADELLRPGSADSEVAAELDEVAPGEPFGEGGFDPPSPIGIERRRRRPGFGSQRQGPTPSSPGEILDRGEEV